MELTVPSSRTDETVEESTHRQRLVESYTALLTRVNNH